MSKGPLAPIGFCHLALAALGVVAAISARHQTLYFVSACSLGATSLALAVILLRGRGQACVPLPEAVALNYSERSPEITEEIQRMQSILAEARASLQGYAQGSVLGLLTMVALWIAHFGSRIDFPLWIPPIILGCAAAVTKRWGARLGDNLFDAEYGDLSRSILAPTPIAG